MDTSFDIRHGFLRFFEQKGHKICKSGPLIPQKDPSLMFANSGMVQFKDIFLGKETRDYVRATTSQKCVRAGGKHNDLENVGYTKRHLTFFEMLGNFSFGDYFKEEAILYAWEFLTKELKLEKEKLYVTVYHTDDEAFNLWKKLTGFEDRKIIRINTQDNFWTMGDTGPCGPCSEIFYDQGPELAGGLPGTKEQDGDRFIEIWNIVFMQNEKFTSGEMKDLSKRSIDTGMGLERITAIMQKVYDNFGIDLFKQIINVSEEISGTKAIGNLKASHQIIADHLRSSAFLIAEGITPSNEGRGYVLRRIMRRATRHVNKLGYKGLMLGQLFPNLVNEMGMAYPELEKQKQFIGSVLDGEEESFQETIESGLKLLNQEVEKLGSGKLFPGQSAFKLHDTYGFPIDLTTDILKEKNIKIDLEEFDQCMKQQREMARKTWAGSGGEAIEGLWFDVKTKIGDVDFIGYENLEAKATIVALIYNGKLVDSIASNDEFFLVTNQTTFFGESGGQAGDVGNVTSEEGAKISVIDTIIPIENLYVHKCKLLSGKIKLEETVLLSVDRRNRDDVRKNHTATHLLHAVLRKKLGESLVQKGSSVRHDRFRFDFNYHKAIASETLDEIEQEINELIIDNLELRTKIMPYEESIKTGSMALFGEKYDEDVRVVYIGGNEKELKEHSSELCKGTHVNRLGDIGMMKILSDTAIASGIRRIEAITGRYASKEMQKNFNEIRNITNTVQSEEGKSLERIKNILAEQKKLQKELSTFKKIEVIKSLKDSKPEAISNVLFLSINANNFGTNSIRSAVQEFLSTTTNSVVLIQQTTNDILLFVIGVTSDLQNKTDANKICNHLIKTFNAKGGGSNLLAQGSLPHKKNLEEQIISEIKKLLALK
jgi:alanyl-tRNA synthetase